MRWRSNVHLRRSFAFLLFTMRVLSFILVLILAVAAVAATGGASSSPNVALPYTDPYLMTFASVSGKQEFVNLMHRHWSQKSPDPEFDIRPFDKDPYTLDQLHTNLNHNRNFRRLVYLGPSGEGRPDMMLATPMHGKSNPDGSILWAFLHAQKPNKVTSHGYAWINPGFDAMTKLRRGKGPGEGDLQIGHVLTIEEVFQRLPGLYTRIP